MSKNSLPSRGAGVGVGSGVGVGVLVGKSVGAIVFAGAGSEAGDAQPTSKRRVIIRIKVLIIFGLPFSIHDSFFGGFKNRTHLTI